MKDVLLIEDDELLRDFLTSCIGSKGLAVVSASDGLEASRLLDAERYRLVITDLKLPGVDGVEILKKVQASHPDTDVIVVTGYGSVENAVECMKQGAFDFLVKPVSKARLEALVDRALERQDLILETRTLRRRAATPSTHGEIVCKSNEIRPEDLPDYIVNGVAPPMSGTDTMKPLEQMEREYVLHVLKACGGNRSKAARLLGIDRGTLARKARPAGEARETE